MKIPSMTGWPLFCQLIEDNRRRGVRWIVPAILLFISACGIDQPSEPLQVQTVVEGTVRSAQTSHPIDGALITEYWKNATGPSTYMDVTDTNGFFRISGSGRVISHISIQAPSYVDTTIRAEEAIQTERGPYVVVLTVSVELTPKTEVDGTRWKCVSSSVKQTIPQCTSGEGVRKTTRILSIYKEYGGLND